jgi:hypothetical protein
VVDAASLFAENVVSFAGDASFDEHEAPSTTSATIDATAMKRETRTVIGLQLPLAMPQL